MKGLSSQMYDLKLHNSHKNELEDYFIIFHESIDTTYL